MITRLSFWDFDGTLMDSPVPEEGRAKWKEVTGSDFPHPTGWWSKPESLDDEVFDIKPFPAVLSQLNDDNARTDTKTILLTNRDIKLAPQVKHLLNKYNIHFDGFSMKDGSGEKDERMDKYIENYPDVKEISFFEDMEDQLTLISRLKRMVLDDDIMINIYKAENGSLALVESFNKLKHIVLDEISKSLYLY